MVIELQPIWRFSPYVFLVLSFIFSMFIAWNMPPFMGADEMNHIHRADLLNYGQLIGERVHIGDDVRAGGTIDRSLYDAHNYFKEIPFHPEIKVDGNDLKQAINVKWQNKLEKFGFENTAVYPPFFYIPQTIAISIGKALNQSVVRTVYFARTANALTCIFIGFLALIIAGRARLVLFTVLMFPMAVSLYGTVTQDGMTIVTAALGCAVLSRAVGAGRPMTIQELCVTTLCFSLVGMVKQPYVFLCLLLLLVETQRPYWRYLATGIALAASLGWYAWMAVAVQTQLIRVDAVVDPFGQITFLLGQPWTVFPIAVNTIKVLGWSYMCQFVGVLGWLDTGLPKIYYISAYIILFLSIALSWPLGTKNSAKRVAMPVAGVLLITAAAIFGALYVVWTPVSYPYVEGVQGRYFLPLAVLIPLMLERAGLSQAYVDIGRWRRMVGATMIIVFPIIGLLITERVIIWRYYLH